MARRQDMVCMLSPVLFEEELGKEIGVCGGLRICGTLLK